MLAMLGDAAAIVGPNGCLYATTGSIASNSQWGSWSTPAPVGGSFAPRGAGLGAATQIAHEQGGSNLTEVTFMAVGSNGGMNVLTSVGLGEGQGGFAGPFPVGATGIFPPGGGVAMANQTADINVALAVGVDGRIYVASVSGDGTWNAPIPIWYPLAPGGGQLALANQTSDLLTGALIGNDGRMWIFWVEGTGAWAQPISIGDPFAPPGAPVALVKQTSDILTFAAIGNDGRVWIASVEGTGTWKAPAPVTGPVTQAGASIAMSKQTDDILALLMIGNDGRFWVTSVEGTGAWQAPVPFGPVIANPGAAVAMTLQYPSTGLARPGAMTLGNDGQLYFTFVTGTNAWSEPVAVPLSDDVTTGTVRPTYKVLTIAYAPPGTNGGKSLSVVDYSTSSTTGTTTSVSDSFKVEVDVSVSLSLGDPKTSSLGIGGEFSSSQTTTNNQSLDVKKTSTFDFKVEGPASDGISHDHDIALLWLNPLLNVSADGWGNTKWDLAVDGDQMVIYPVYFGWLRDPTTMPAAEAAYLKSVGLTDADFATILALNPFATGSTAIDPDRFTPLSYTFPYVPPFSANDPVNPVTQMDQHDLYGDEFSNTNFHLWRVSNDFGIVGSIADAQSH